MKGSVSAVGQNLLLCENRRVDLLAQELGRGIKEPFNQSAETGDRETSRRGNFRQSGWPPSCKPITVGSSRGSGAQL